MSPLRLAYGTNGFTGHRFDDACAVLAELGYDGVGLSLDQPHLDPFAEDVVERTRRVRRSLDRHDLDVVVETGSRYVLDPWHKHEPTLVSDEGRDRRVVLLRRALRIAAELGAEAMSCWSGTLPGGVDDETAWSRVTDGLEPVLELAAELGVLVCFEPEPGMFVATLDDALELRRRLGEPDGLRLTLDLGHLVCNEPRSPVETIERAGALVGNVHVDDQVRDVHEHLELGTGELDLDAVLGALVASGFDGLAAVELPRHAHAAPVVAERSMEALRAALDRVAAATSPPPGSPA